MEKIQKKRILIVGAGVHAKVILDIIEMDSSKIIIGFTDNDITKIGKNVHGIPILGSDANIEELYKKKKFDSIIIGLGYKLIKARKNIIERVKSLGIPLDIAIHPSAIISKHVKIGEGTVIMAGAVINPDTIIGQNCVINTRSIVDHDNHIQDNVFILIGANLAGNVIISSDTVIGMGTNIIENIKVGSHSLVGAGSVVTKDIPSNVIFYGNPAKYNKDNN